MSKRGLQHVFKHLDTVRNRVIRVRIKRKPKPRWWLVYGPPRSGTTYMHRILISCAALHVSDWGLAPVLKPIPDWLEIRASKDFGYIRFDYQRFLSDISRNILDNAYLGSGDQLDLVYKQATLRPSEYETLISMWGQPERAIFCIREPAGYMASAKRKFIYDTVERLQQVYIDSVASYSRIRGDLFEYGPELTVSDYTSFLQPLSFEGKRLPPFRFTGVEDLEDTNETMRNSYDLVKELAAS